MAVDTRRVYPSQAGYNQLVPGTTINVPGANAVKAGQWDIIDPLTTAYNYWRGDHAANLPMMERQDKYEQLLAPYPEQSATRLLSSMSPIEPFAGVGKGVGLMAGMTAIPRKMSPLIKQGIRGHVQNPLGVLERPISHTDTLKSMKESMQSMGITSKDLFDPSSPNYDNPIVKEFRGAMQNQMPDTLLHGTTRPKYEDAIGNRWPLNKAFDKIEGRGDIGPHVGYQQEANIIKRFDRGMEDITDKVVTRLEELGLDTTEDIPGWKMRTPGHNPGDRLPVVENNFEKAMAHLETQQPELFKGRNALQGEFTKQGKKIKTYLDKNQKIPQKEMNRFEDLKESLEDYDSFLG